MPFKTSFSKTVWYSDFVRRKNRPHAISSAAARAFDARRRDHILFTFVCRTGDERPENPERAGGVADEEPGVVEFPRGLDQSAAEVRLFVLQRQVVRRAGGAERFRRPGRAEQRAEQSLHPDQSDGIRGARGKGICAGSRKRR